MASGKTLTLNTGYRIPVVGLGTWVSCEVEIILEETYYTESQLTNDWK